MSKPLAAGMRDDASSGDADGNEGVGGGVERASATVHAYIELKRLVLEGKLHPGRTFLQQKLAEMLGVSRTPIREAVIKLAEEGLVEIRPRYGVYVRPVTMAELRDAYELLGALESYATLQAGNKGLSPEALQRLSELHKVMEAATGAKNIVTWVEADKEFHTEIVKACGNQQMFQLVQATWERFSRARAQLTPLRSIPILSNQEHAGILAALAKNDGRKAWDAMLKHRERAAADTMDTLRRRGVTEL